VHNGNIASLSFLLFLLLSGCIPIRRLLQAYSGANMRAKLTPALVKKTTDEKKPVFVWDTSLPGFGLMITAAGHRSWPVQYKQRGVSRRRNLPGVLDLGAARKEAKAILGAAAAGRDPIGERRQQAREAKNTLQFIHSEYFAREGAKLKSVNRQKREWERLILPKLGNRPITDIKRSDVIRLLDNVEDECGTGTAQSVLAFLSRVLNWHASRDDDFRSPIVRGMTRLRASENARNRTLSDDEVRAVWRAAEADMGAAGQFVRFLFLTAVRRTEASCMTWDELDGGDWVIPADRMKGKQEHIVPLSSAARAVLESIPRIGAYVFTGDGQTAIAGFTWLKAKIDEASGVADWRLHDLRRTARSLLSRAGVSADTAERCLAHKLGGVRGVYDRYAYHAEKKHAFEALAAQIERIVYQSPDVVVPMWRQA
jgi:integrase